jgi:hypothetical protein
MFATDTLSPLAHLKKGPAHSWDRVSRQEDFYEKIRGGAVLTGLLSYRVNLRSFAKTTLKHVSSRLA